MIYFPNAKINLGLKILNRRTDGYHDLESVFIPVGWCDVLEVHTNKKRVNGKLNFSIQGLDIEGSVDSNLVVKAHELLKKDYDLPEITATLLKNIPSGAGLGGGSSDGSFMLKAINELCNLELSIFELEAYAAELGSDCPFFIKNEPSRVSGRGDIIEEFNVGDNLLNQEILIVFPIKGINTGEAFELLNGQSSGADFNYINLDTIYNDFQKPIAERVSEVDEAIEFVKSKGANFTQMSGSGSAVFGLFKREKVDGLHLVEEAKLKGWSVYFGAFL